MHRCQGGQAGDGGHGDGRKPEEMEGGGGEGKVGSGGSGWGRAAAHAARPRRHCWATWPCPPPPLPKPPAVSLSPPFSPKAPAHQEGDGAPPLAMAVAPRCGGAASVGDASGARRRRAAESDGASAAMVKGRRTVRGPGRRAEMVWEGTQQGVAGEPAPGQHATTSTSQPLHHALPRRPPAR